MSSTRQRQGDEAVNTRMPPKDEMSFGTFLWNPKTKTVLGRSGSSWAKIGLFYIVFYGFLAAFFSIMMVSFNQTLNYDSPKYTGSDSLLVNPGLGFRPRTHNENDLKPTISYDPESCVSYAAYVDSIKQFLKAYESSQPNAEDCSLGAGFREEGGEVCNFNISNVKTSCFHEENFGYDTHSPCIFLKLNKMFHWKPEPLKSMNGLPEGLKAYITESGDSEEKLKQNVWVWCESQEVTLEQLWPAIPISYFPYYKQKGYLAPFVPVRLQDIKDGQEGNVTCQVWAGNVDHSVNGRRTGEARIFFHVYKR